MENIKLIGVEDVMRMLDVGRKTATQILNMKGCPILPRHKGEPYRVREESFVEWFKENF